MSIFFHNPVGQYIDGVHFVGNPNLAAAILHIDVE